MSFAWSISELDWDTRRVTEFILLLRVQEWVMGKLGKQLRELDKDAFESFVHQYLIAKYPSAHVKKVEGTGGDSGVDSFSGLLATGPAIWQSKHFPNRIKQPQRKQILKSIKVAFTDNKPSVWTLCVPIDLRTAEHKWFQSAVVEMYGGLDRIQLLQASDFETELLHNRNLRDAFFPDNAASNMLEIRRIVTGAGTSSPAEIGRLATEFAQQYLSAKVDIEPRLQPVLTIGGSALVRSVGNQPGWVMSISQGEQTISYFARDPKSYNLDPITVSVEVAHEEHTALKEALETGRPLTLPPGKLLRLESSSPSVKAIFAGQDFGQVRLELSPFLSEELASRNIPLRFIAGAGPRARELYYVPFRVVRAGQREVSLSSRSELPIDIDMTLRLPPERKAKLNLRPLLLGAELQALHQVIQFLDEIERSGVIEIRSLETNAIFLTDLTINPGTSVTISKAMKTIIGDGALVSSYFKVLLRLPEKISKREADDLHTLKLIISGEEFFNFYLDAVLIKDNVARDRAGVDLNQRLPSIKLDHPKAWRNFEVFGERIQTGSATFVADNAEMVDFDGFRKSYLAAEDGEAVPVRFHCEGPCRWILGKKEWDPRSPFLIDGGSSPRKQDEMTAR